jgi:hypothetical protein
VLVVGLQGCATRKSEECQRLVGAINAIRLEMIESEDRVALESLADQAQRAGASLAEPKLADVRLVSLRDRYRRAAQSYAGEVRAMAQGLGELRAARTEAADAAVRQSIKDRTSARHDAARRFAGETSSVTSELNAYCSGR